MDAKVNLAAALADKIRRMFPKLAGTILGIEEFLNQRSPERGS